MIKTSIAAIIAGLYAIVFITLIGIELDSRSFSDIRWPAFIGAAIWVVYRRHFLAPSAVPREVYEINPLLLSPTEYEEYCAELLRQAGWRITLTKGSGDQGADVVAELRGIKAVVQCKRYGKRVGNAAVMQAVASKAFYRAQISVVVCPVGYTPHAWALAKSNRTILLIHDRLPDLEKLARIP